MKRVCAALVLLAGCGGGSLPPSSDAGGGHDLAGAGGGQWYSTCGDPVCRGHSNHPGVSACTTEKPGDACSPAGAQCDPGSACNQLLQCATSDPTHGGVCPISRKRFKEDIVYLDQAGLDRVYGELMKLPLATWRYKGTTPRRLGFLIDDAEQAPAVDPERDMVDLYGYTSMAVAALKVQAREIAELRREIAKLKRGRSTGE
jgi:hypothetical protein